MKLMKLSDIFYVRYGHSLELNRLKLSGTDGIPFVSRQMGNNGISAYVEPISGVTPAEPGELTCALSGNGVLSTFIQPRPYYTGFHVACLRPKLDLSVYEKLYYCACIKKNRYRYSYGRQANRTLRDILIPSPDDIPAWIHEADITKEFDDKLNDLSKMSEHSPHVIHPRTSDDSVTIEDLFEVVYGHSLELNRMTYDNDGINFVSRTSKNNGVSAKVAILPNISPAPSGLITVACGGSVLETFLQLFPFYCGRDMYWLSPKYNMTVEEKLFYCACIRSNKFRYNYGRQANKTLRYIKIPALHTIPKYVYGALEHTTEEWKRKTIISIGQ